MPGALLPYIDPPPNPLPTLYPPTYPLSPYLPPTPIQQCFAFGHARRCYAQPTPLSPLYPLPVPPTYLPPAPCPQSSSASLSAMQDGWYAHSTPYPLLLYLSPYHPIPIPPYPPTLTPTPYSYLPIDPLPPYLPPSPYPPTYSLPPAYPLPTP